MLEMIVIIGMIILCIFVFVVIMGGTNIRFHNRHKENQIRVACVGDSTTYGTVIPNVFYNCYPAQLGRMLGDKYHVSNFGFNGKTALDINENSFRRTNQYPLSVRYQPNIVIIMLGTNDTKLQNWVSQERYKEDYKSLIQTYLDLDSKPKVILCTPNSAYSVKGRTDGIYNYGINEAGLQKECKVVKELVDEMQLDFIDMYNVTANHSEWYRFDGIHPNKGGAKAVARAVYERIM